MLRAPRRGAQDDASLPADPETVRTLIARALRTPARPEAQGTSGETAAALGRLERSLEVLDQIQAILIDIGETLAEAGETASTARRALLAERYDELRLAIDAAVADAPEAALVSPGARPLSHRTRAGALAIHPIALHAGAGGLDLPPPETWFVADGELDAVRDAAGRAARRCADAGIRFADAAALILGDTACG